MGKKKKPKKPAKPPREEERAPSVPKAPRPPRWGVPRASSRWAFVPGTWAVRVG
jgi:hypothetical protein